MQALHHRFNARNGKAVRAASPASGDAPVERYPWPGNIRELRNVVERAAILSAGGFIEPEHLPASFTPWRPSRRLGGLGAGMTVDEAERRLIEITLAHTRDNKTTAAEILGFTVKTLHNKLKRFRREAEEKLAVMRVSLRARQTAAVTVLIALAMSVLSLQHLAQLARMGLEDSRGIGDLLGRMVYQRAREAIAAGGDPVAALRKDQGIRSILESTAAYGRNVTYAAVVDNDGVAIAHSFPALEGRKVAPGENLSEVLQRNTLAQVRTIYAGSQPGRGRCRCSLGKRRSVRFAWASRRSSSATTWRRRAPAHAVDDRARVVHGAARRPAPGAPAF